MAAQALLGTCDARNNGVTFKQAHIAYPKLSQADMTKLRVERRKAVLSQRAKGHAAHHRSPVRGVPRRSLLAPATVAPIRVNIEYQDFDPDLSEEQVAQLKLVVSTAVRVLQRYIGMASPVEGNLLIPPVCEGTLSDRADTKKCTSFYPDFVHAIPAKDANFCGRHATINSSHVGPTTKGGKGGVGEPVDYYLYVTAVTSAGDACGPNKVVDPKAGYVVAYAGPCFFYVNEAGTMVRPAAGSINICPHAVFADALDVVDDAVEVITHELLHALGFLSAMFPYYSDSLGFIRTDITGEYTSPSTGNQTAFVTAPEVVNYAKEYFGCPSLQGVKFEDEGGLGTANGHWDYSLLQAELMVGFTNSAADGSPSRISPFTLHLLESSGWYVTNLDESYPLDWGKGAGCVFAEDCKAYMRQSPDSFFCKESETANKLRLVETCAVDYQAQVVCASSVYLGNGCPMWQTISPIIGYPSCLLPPDENTWVVAGSSSGPSYRCASLAENIVPIPLINSTKKLNALCFDSSCSAAGNFSYNIAGVEVSCPTGEAVDLTTVPDLQGGFRSGIVECPDNVVACRSLSCPNACSGNGACISGKCICRMMYSGLDCSTDLKNSTGPPPSFTVSAPAQSPPEPNSKDDIVHLLFNVTLNNTAVEFDDARAKFITALATLVNNNVSEVNVTDVLESGTAPTTILDPIFGDRVLVMCSVGPMTREEADTKPPRLEDLSSRKLTPSQAFANDLEAAQLTLVSWTWVESVLVAAPPGASPPPGSPGSATNTTNGVGGRNLGWLIPAAAVLSGVALAM